MKLQPETLKAEVVTWGNSFHGGDSSRVQEQLTNVKQVQAGRCGVYLGAGETL